MCTCMCMCVVLLNMAFSEPTSHFSGCRFDPRVLCQGSRASDQVLQPRADRAPSPVSVQNASLPGAALSHSCRTQARGLQMGGQLGQLTALSQKKLLKGLGRSSRSGGLIPSTTDKKKAIVNPLFHSSVRQKAGETQGWRSSGCCAVCGDSVSAAVIQGLCGQGCLRHMLAVLAFCRVQWVALS